jgi:uncharacterized membrane protein YgcG
MERSRCRILVSLLLLAGGASFAPAQGRSLYWRSFDVEARLDSAGRLHVRERQQMVFTGAWNGGERVFRVEPGQRFEFGRLLRVDPATGAERVLSRGDLDGVDHWDFTDSRTLRWRSRRPADPPFLETELVYVLEYRLSNILVPSNGAYVLDHDFLMPDRVGVVDAFTLTLELDGAWGAPPGFPGRYRARGVPPGEGFVVTLPLRYTFAGRPAGVEFGAGMPGRLALALLLVSGVVVAHRRFRQRERSLGRFDPLIPSERIDESWLEEHVFAHRPEVVGAAWDGTTGTPEVTAVLARLEAEGKLKSEVKARGFLRAPVLHLNLLVARGRLSDYERVLIDALFRHDSNQTSTEEVRKRYQKTGFDPASRIRARLTRIANTLGSRGEAPEKPSWRPTLLLLVVALFLFVIAIVRRPSDAFVLVMTGGVLVFLYVVAVIGAALFRSRVHDSGSMLRFEIPLGLGLAGVLALLLNAELRVGLFALGALTALSLAIGRSVFNQATSRESGERIAFRKRLASAREYLRRQLEQPQPALRDEWFPYLIGFGLAKQMDRWFRAFGGETGRDAGGLGAISGASARSSSGGSSSWTGFGGGGGFSGGGASSSWAAAAGAMAAGVSAPSSGGSGGGGGGGGGSSGGGGGGGW